MIFYLEYNSILRCCSVLEGFEWRVFRSSFPTCFYISGFGDLVPLHPYPGQDTVAYAAHVTVFTVMTLLYFTVGLAIVSSMMLSISAAMEDPSLLGFHRVASTDQATTCKDTEFE